MSHIPKEGAMDCITTYVHNVDLSISQSFFGLVIFVLFFYGYINNIIKLWRSREDLVDLMMVMRVIGIFIPLLGAILGYF